MGILIVLQLGGPVNSPEQLKVVSIEVFLSCFVPFRTIECITMFLSFLFMTSYFHKHAIKNESKGNLLHCTKGHKTKAKESNGDYSK